MEQKLVKWDFQMTPAASGASPISGVARLAGPTRIDTALAVARAAYPGKVENVVLATADNYPDALAGSVYAAKLKAPVILVDGSGSLESWWDSKGT